MANSQAEQIIPPEIKNDEFYDLINRLAREADIKTVLEIGSSSGEGSTEAFVKGLRDNPNNPTLFCLEVSKSRFAKLEKTYRDEEFVKPYNTSSVALNRFPTKTEVVDFYENHPTRLNQYSLDLVLSWLEQDKKYVQDSQVSEDGIKRIIKDNRIDFFDLVLIDGSEFTGWQELQDVLGAKFILLDDINAFKNYRSHQQLLSNRSYELIWENQRLRNGFSIFKKKSAKTDAMHRLTGNISIPLEHKEQLLTQQIVSKGAIVFDVGANVGDYSIWLSNLVGYFGKVYAFEPTSHSFEEFEKRIEQYDTSNVFIEKKAIFSENKLVEINEFPDEYSAWNSLGKPVMGDPSQNFTQIVPIVKQETVEAITLDLFCQEKNIEFIDFLKIDVEGAESEVFKGASRLLANQKVRFIQFEISQNMLKGFGKTAKESFEPLLEHNYECHRIDVDGRIGELATDSNSYYENYIAFPCLPIHFFTIVLNGEPFIRYHIEILKHLPFDWHWHIVEGVADLKHDTAWSLKLGGQIPENLHRNGRSQDGTSEYLDELAQQYPDRVTIYRKPEGEFWDGKLEMVSAPLENIQEECLLWQVDVDELWTFEQICNARKLFISNPEKTAAFYWCWYFMGEELIVSTRNCYTQNPQQEWLRTWRFKPGYVWAAHEPPVLVEPLPDGNFRNVAAIAPFSHAETEAEELIFQHFAYVLPEQLQFKEQYYGYQNALVQWQNLQAQQQFPVQLRDYLAWVQDGTEIERARTCGVVPIIRRESQQGDWQFLSSGELQIEQEKQNRQLRKPRIVVDGVFFQRYSTGIARVWTSLLQEWANTGFLEHILFLDRGGMTPDIGSLLSLNIPQHDYNNLERDRAMLQEICDREGADIFISTYYSFPLTTPSVLMAHDMIPELVGADLTIPMWWEKQEALKYASAYLAVSENTARDLQHFCPDVETVTVARNGVKYPFEPATPEEVANFKLKYGIAKPYFLLVAPGTHYKNGHLFFQAFAQLVAKQGFELVCTRTWAEKEFRQYTAGVTVHVLELQDEELRLAYAGAVAMVYPSKYEGFGLPVLEAMACGCPVITCPNSSLPEVAGDAAIYVGEDDVAGMMEALCDVQKPSIRAQMIAAGLQQAQKFSWAEMAKTVRSVLLETTLLPLNLRENNTIALPDWTKPEEELGEDLQQALAAIVSHPDRAKMTLLIDSSGISEEDANLFLSGVAMNLLMEQDLEVGEEIAISLVGELGAIQWDVLVSRLRSRLVLKQENPARIAQTGCDRIPAVSLETFAANSQ